MNLLEESIDYLLGGEAEVIEEQKIWIGYDMDMVSSDVLYSRIDEIGKDLVKNGFKDIGDRRYYKGDEYNGIALDVLVAYGAKADIQQIANATRKSKQLAGLNIIVRHMEGEEDLNIHQREGTKAFKVKFANPKLNDGETLSNIQLSDDKDRLREVYEEIFDKRAIALAYKKASDYAKTLANRMGVKLS